MFKPVELEQEKSNKDIFGYNCSEKYIDMFNEFGERGQFEILKEMGTEFNVYVAKSNIHGTGVFALTDLKEG